VHRGTILETALASLPAGAKPEKELFCRDGFEIASFVLCKSPIGFVSPKLVVLFFRQILQAIEELARQFSTGSQWKLENLSRDVFQASAHRRA
jgi:hypothetical protein